MEKEKTVESTISGFTSTILRSHFGKGPSSVYVTIKAAYVCIQVRGFLTPMEKILLDQKERNRILEMRDLLTMKIEEEFKRMFWKEAGLEISELYADWNLEDKTGVLLGVLAEEVPGKEPWPKEVNAKALHQEIVRVSILGQKEPEKTELFWLSDRTLLIKRTGIFTLLEKEFIKNGLVEALKLAKRPLEYNLFAHSQLTGILKRPITEIFVDWNFDEDKGFAVLVLGKTL